MSGLNDEKIVYLELNQKLMGATFPKYQKKEKKRNPNPIMHVYVPGKNTFLT